MGDMIYKKEKEYNLLNSNDSVSQIKNLYSIYRDKNYKYFSEVIQLIDSDDSSVAKVANGVAVYMAEQYIQEKDKTLGRIALLNSMITILKHDSDFIKQIFSNLQSADINYVINAVRILEYFVNETEALNLLPLFLEHPNPRVRATACLHIGFSSAQKSTLVLSEFLQDNDPRVKANVLELMAEFNNKKYLSIVEPFRYDKDNRVRANALLAIYKFRQEDLFADIEGMLIHEDILFRISGVWLVGEIGNLDSNYYKLLKLVLDEENEQLQEHLKNILKKRVDVRELRFLKIHFMRTRPELFEPDMLTSLPVLNFIDKIPLVKNIFN